MTATRKTPRSLWIPWTIALLFLPVLAVNGLLVKLALSSNTGLVSDNAFDTGQSYNSIIAAGERQRALGWSLDAALAALPDAVGHAARLTITARAADGSALAGLALQGRLYSPVDPQPDQILVLSDDGGGTYHQDVTLPRAGQWDVQVTAKNQAGDFSIAQRVLVR